jgi:hypothetical protein
MSAWAGRVAKTAAGGHPDRGDVGELHGARTPIGTGAVLCLLIACHADAWLGTADIAGT